MILKNLKKTKFIVITSLFLCSGVLSPVAAQTSLTITGNGSDSTQTIDTSSSNITIVDQNNSMYVNNTVNSESNTGNNTASDNTGGGVGVATGDVSSATQIHNSGNINSASTGCCAPNTDATISGNGSESTSNIQLNRSNTITINSNNVANIHNSIYGSANTGYNSIQDNGGDVSLDTGDINAWAKIHNSPINISDIEANSGAGGDVKAVISGNGADSRNTLDLLFNNDTSIYVNNLASIFNKTIWDLNTGHNSVDDNLGDVKLATGDINFKALIENGPINVNKVNVACDCEEKPAKPVKNEEKPHAVQVVKIEKVEKPIEVKEVVTKHAVVLAAAVGQILPVTGNNWIFLALFANVLTLLYGFYLRLRSGNAPSVVS